MADLEITLAENGRGAPFESEESGVRRLFQFRGNKQAISVRSVNSSSRRTVLVHEFSWGIGCVVGRVLQPTTSDSDDGCRRSLMRKAREAWITSGVVEVSKILKGPNNVCLIDCERHCLLFCRDLGGRVPAFIKKREERKSPVFLKIATMPSSMAEITPKNVRPSKVKDFILNSWRGSRRDFFAGYRCLLPGQYLTINANSRIRTLTLWNQNSRTSAGSGSWTTKLRNCLEESFRLRPDPSKRVHSVSGGLDSSVLLSLDASLYGPENVAGVSMRAGPTALEPEDQLRSLEQKVNVNVQRYRIAEEAVFHGYQRFQENLEWGPRAYSGDLLQQDFLNWAHELFPSRRIVQGVDADGLISASRLKAFEQKFQDNQFRTILEIATQGSGFGVADLARLIKEEARKLLERKWGSTKVLDILSLIRSVSRDLEPFRQPSRWIRNQHSDPSAVSVDHFAGNAQTFLLETAKRYMGWSWEMTTRTAEVQTRRGDFDIDWLYMDDKIMLLTASMPAGCKWSSVMDRPVLRECARDLLPKKIYNRPKSGLLSSIVDEGLRQVLPRLKRILRKECYLQDLGVIDINQFLVAVERYINALERRNPKTDAPLGSSPIWRTLSSELWLRSVDNRSINLFFE